MGMGGSGGGDSGGRNEEDRASRTLLTETREQQSEVKVELGRMTRKLDDITLKVSERKMRNCLGRQTDKWTDKRTAKWTDKQTETDRQSG